MLVAQISTSDQLLNLWKYVIPLILAGVISLVLVRAMIALAPKFGLIDQPDARRIHQEPIPRAGGIGVFLAFHLTFLLAHLLIGDGYRGNLDFNWWLVFFPASFILFVTGIVDDCRGISPLVKLLAQTSAAVVLFEYSDNRFGQILGMELPVWLDLGLTVFWCVALINAFNLIDGLDGLCAGLAIISSTGMAAAFLYRGMPGETIALLILIGSALGFLRYNFHPARIFLGDTGSMFIGFTLAAISLESGGKSTLLVSLGIPFIAAGIPIMDTVLAIWRRSIRRIVAKVNGVEAVAKVMGADREHLHHRLLDAGMNQRRVAILLYIANIFLVALGLMWILSSQWSLALFLIMLSLTLYVVVRHVVHVELWDTGVLIATGLKRPGRKLIGQISYPAFDLVWLMISFFVAILLADIETLDSLRFRTYIHLLPLWILPVIALLMFTNSYARIWRLAVFRDFLTLVTSIVFGVVIPFSITNAFSLAFTIENLQFAIFYTVLACVGMVTFRASRHMIREWVATAIKDKKTSNRYETRNVLVYGAGDRGLLFIRDWMMVHPEEMARNRIVGFIDDDPALRKRYLSGHKILGTGTELEHFIDHLGVDTIVLCCHLSKPAADHVIQVCRSCSLTLREWNRQQFTLLDRGADPKEIRKIPQKIHPSRATGEDGAPPDGT